MPTGYGIAEGHDDRHSQHKGDRNFSIAVGPLTGNFSRLGIDHDLVLLVFVSIGGEPQGQQNMFESNVVMLNLDVINVLSVSADVMPDVGVDLGGHFGLCVDQSGFKCDLISLCFEAC